MERRPVESRNKVWAQKIARWLKDKGMKPNTVSVFSSVFAFLAACSFWLSGQSEGTGWGFLLLAAVMIQMRLLCNLFDGMIAVEGGLKSKAGDIYNDAPDRLSDILILVGASYAIRSISYAGELGWMAATFAVFTAYVRVLGSSCGTKSYFFGPMAKQHRMAVITFASLLAIPERLVYGTDWVLLCALIIVFGGSVLTTGRRLIAIVRELESRP